MSILERNHTYGKNSSARPNKELWSIVLIELTSHCNFSCSFCPSDSMVRKKTGMKRVLWEKILNELGEKKMTRKVFFHVLGEPLVYKDLFDAIALANDCGLSVSLYTNGALLNEERSLKLLEVLRNGCIVLSMQEFDLNSFHQRSHGNLSWKEYIKRLQNFVRMVEIREKSIPVQVHCMIDMRSMGWNLFKILREQKCIQAVYDHWRNALGISKGKRINILNPTASYPLGAHSSFFVKYEGNWSNQLIDNQFEVIPKDRGHCALMTDTFVVLSDGTCTFCCSDYEGKLNLGNAYEKSLEAIYYGEKATRIREEEKHGWFIERRCQICRGTLIFKKNRKSAYSRINPSDYYVFKEHLSRYGLKSSMRKIIGRII